MVVCKYFLQGTCKFGTYCNYEHQAPSNYTSFSDNNRHQSASILRQPNFGSTQPQNAKSSGSATNVDINTLVKSVVNDMTGAEKGGQWLLSCYAPFKEKPALPGFEDQSPEEIRFGYYEAQKNGTVEQYKAQLQAVLQNTAMKIKALQNPAQDVIVLLQTIYNTPPSSHSGTYGQNITTVSSSTINQQNTFTLQNQSVFGQNNDNIFKTNNQPNNTNIFGAGSPQSNWQQNQGQTNIFSNSATSQPTNQNIFGGNNFAQTPSNSFVSPQGSNIFANSGQAPGSSSNIFATQTVPVPPQSIFGATQSAQQQQPTNMFTSTVPANTQLTQQPTNIFAPTAPTNPNQTPFTPQNINPPPAPTNPNQNPFTPQNINQQTIFGQQASQQAQHNIFATQNQPSNIFSLQNQNKPQNIFTSNTEATQFANPQLTAVQSTPPSYSASIFGYPTNSNQAMSFASTVQQPIDDNLYSKLEELTDAERKWFESDTLDMMNIPDKPPTYDMCFKV